MHRDPDNYEAEAIRSCLSAGAGHTLEIGCGSGRLTGDLARFAKNMLAVDAFLEELVSTRCCVEDPVGLVAASGESLPLKADSMDTVAFTLSLHHHDPDKALVEAIRILRENGRILVLEPVGEALLNRLFGVLDDESEKYALAEKAIGECGLEVIRTGSVGGLWMFEDFSELAGYLFDYFRLPPNPEQEMMMARILGERRELSPLPIKDITRFWLLAKS